MAGQGGAAQHTALWKPSKGASSQSHAITGLAKGKFYMVRVLAVNGVGDSEGSSLAWAIPGSASGEYGHYEPDE